MAGNAGMAPGSTHQETRVATFNGFAGLALGVALIALAGYMIYGGIAAAASYRSPGAWPFVEGALIFVAAALVLGGLYTLQPNEAAIPGARRASRGCARRIRSTRARIFRFARAT